MARLWIAAATTGMFLTGTFLTGMFLLGLASAAAAAPGWGLEKVALEGESAPGTTRSYGGFDHTRDGGAGAAFVAMLPGTPMQWGAFQRVGDDVVAVALPGESAPGTGGTYSFLFPFPAVGPGVVSFPSNVSGGSAQNGIFRVAGGGNAAVVLWGDAAPGGGSFEPSTTDLQLHAVNRYGAVAFRSDLAGGLAGQGVFVAEPQGGFSTVALLDGLAPGGSWSAFGWPSLNDAGQVAFAADVELDGGGSANGLFLDLGGASTLALQGDPAPATGGATFDRFFYPAVNAGGDVAFVAQTLGGSASGGLFIATAGTTVPLVVEGQVLPGTDGRSITSFGPTFPTLNARGSSAFCGSLSGGGGDGGVFLHHGPSGSVRPVALTGEEAPDTGGAVFSFFEFVGLDEAGNVSFEAQLSDGRSGIFLASPLFAPLVPALSTQGSVALSLLLAALTLAFLRVARASEP